MTGKQFYDWQTSGGTNDVMRLVDCLERADIAWCAIGGVAVNHGGVMTKSEYVSLSSYREYPPEEMVRRAAAAERTRVLQSASTAGNH